MVAVVSLSASAAYAGHATPSQLSRGHRARQPRPAARAAPSRAVHPSRSKKAQVRGAPRRERLDVLTKLGMWGVDLDRMRGEGRESETEDADDEAVLSSSSNAPPSDASSESGDDVVASAEARSAAAPPPSPPRESPPETEPSSASARLASLLSRQKAEMWPTVGTDAWARARARIVSASEASAALGLDRYRSPERLIADKLARLDAAEGVDAATLLAIAALNPGYDPDGAPSAEPVRRSGSRASLGWRAKASGKKGGKKQKKHKRGVGGRVPSTRIDANDAPSTRFAPPAVTHGNDFEPVARAHYAKTEGVEVHEFGLKIHDRLPWLGATPDGVAVVEDKKDANANARLVVLEIKCPYTRPVLPKTRAKEHFPQIQVLMQVFGAEACHFVQYKPPGVGRGRAGVMNEDRPLYLKETVARDDGWWDANRPRLERFSEKLRAALAAREASLAATGWGWEGDRGGVVEDWQEDVLANVDGV